MTKNKEQTYKITLILTKIKMKTKYIKNEILFTIIKVFLL